MFREVMGSLWWQERGLGLAFGPGGPEGPEGPFLVNNKMGFISDQSCTLGYCNIFFYYGDIHKLRKHV